MSVMSGPNTTTLVTRVQNILLRPAAEWDVIAAEPASVGGLYTGYACVLAAIPAIASIVASLLFLHFAVMFVVVTAVLSYVLALVGVYVIAFMVDALAPSFGGEKNQIQALKLVIYGYTAAWVAGIAVIIPILGALVALAGGIYSLYTLYIGMPKLMKCPADKTLGYFIVTIIIAVVVYVVINAVVGAVALMAAGGAMMAAVH
jgi:hypothetical protein